MAKKKAAADTTSAVPGVAASGAVIDNPERLNLITAAQVMYFDPDMFTVVHGFNNRAFADEFADADFLDLKQSIKDMGVLQPILFNVEEDAPTLKIGSRRLEAVKQLRAEYPDNARFATIPAIQLNGGGADNLTLLRANLAENLRRKGLSAMDRAYTMKQFVDAGMTQSRIAEEMGLSKGLVSKRLALLALPEALQRQVHEGKLDADAAYELSKKDADTQSAAVETLTADMEDAQEVPALGQPETTGNRVGRKKKKVKITRKAAKTAKVAKSAAPGKKKKLAAPADKTRSRDDVFNFFSAAARDKEVKETVRALAKVVVSFMDGRASAAKLSGVLVESTKGR